MPAPKSRFQAVKRKPPQAQSCACRNGRIDVPGYPRSTKKAFLPNKAIFEPTGRPIRETRAILSRSCKRLVLPLNLRAHLMEIMDF